MEAHSSTAVFLFLVLIWAPKRETKNEFIKIHKALILLVKLQIANKPVSNWVSIWAPKRKTKNEQRNEKRDFDDIDFYCELKNNEQ